MAAISVEEVYERYVLPLPEAERQRLVEMTERDLDGLRPEGRRWHEWAGRMRHPMAGEDAQVWVSRGRREADETRRGERG